MALPDDGTIYLTGGTVTLDGSGSGGAWGANVTYGWALTDPASGVTVTFDDAASAKTEVTIPALAGAAELTFSLSVTGRGEGAGVRPGGDTATVIVVAGICDRTPEVRDALVALILGVSNCADVTAAHLAAITGTLELFGQQITALAVGDFAGLTSLTHLSLYDNALTTLPTGVFAELTSLTELSLYSNALTTLPDDVFAELTALTELKLGSNRLSTLPDGVFDGLTRLETLALHNNALTMLDAGVFDGLTSLTSLNLHGTRLVTLSDDVFNGLTSLTVLYLNNNELTTLGAEVFNGLTSLTVLRLAHNELTTLDDDVFEPLTALIALTLRGNPGAPFAPEVVALPDDGTVSNGGGHGDARRQRQRRAVGHECDLWLGADRSGERGDGDV